MRYGHIINYFTSSPWAILPEKFEAILSILELRAAGVNLTDPDIEARIGPKPERPEIVKPTSIAVIPLIGTISHRASMLQRSSGGISVDEFRHDFRAAVQNPEVGAVVLEIDSPGGSTNAIEELADEVFAARGKKRIIAVANSMAASAAYWIGSQAHEFVASPSALVGSIGVLGVHMDESEAAKAQGLRVTVVSAGKYKGEASEYTPLSSEAREHLQGLVDDRYDAFVRAVARGRGVALKAVREGFGQGRVVTAKESVAQGMADSIDTLDATIGRVADRAVKARSVASAVAWQVPSSSEAHVLAATVAQIAAELEPRPEIESAAEPIPEPAQYDPDRDPDRVLLELMQLG